ncbi:hypothetical protein TNCV_674941 [Trichonephila clavipes]|nr:hypothetical protein TNCV_674941 [Trichonephila clavipes]
MLLDPSEVSQNTGDTPWLAKWLEHRIPDWRAWVRRPLPPNTLRVRTETATAGSDVVQSGRPIFDDFFQHLWPYIGKNTANVVFQMIKRLWLIRIDQ